jgi:hypothetical protein
MGFFPGIFKSIVDFTGGWKISGTTVTATAAEINRLHTETLQTLAADGAITVKNGVCIISKTVPGIVAATLADPTTGTDDFKRLTIINGTAHASTVTSATSFGGGGSGEDVATFSGVVGDVLNLMAYGGKWYVVGYHQCTLA